MKATRLALPDFYKESNAQDPNYQPDKSILMSAAGEWVKRFNLKPVGGDKLKIFMLCVDNQRDFSFPQGSLYVGGRSGNGAMDDQDRLAKFIYTNLGLITQIICTLDTHLPFQIFHPLAHLKADDSFADAHTIIKDYRDSGLRPNPAMAVQLGVSPTWLQRQFIYYCDQLVLRNPDQSLYIWPFHCLIGEPGHALAGVVEKARLFHSMARGAANIPEIKGGNPLTEHYSIFRPEVMTLWDGKPIPGAQKNAKLLETLMLADVVVIVGQAKSHCMAASIGDFLTEILAKDPELAKKVYLVEDCTSSVVVPGVVDFTDMADQTFQKFADAGMNLVVSTESIETWPGMAEKLAKVA
ncbi:nicotinamidase [Patescibacteria group bacterium]|nr:nicotinamidase [Patescibacteria group bacterium]MBU2220049.1 nicotinamidase [Patescibacteria group bacterium]MBU2265002.1 nicotinamidase [Patescibacteria group bacterium]